ncbi:MAG TPA: hypothetical protein VE153_20480, partial [Myxococcus sp.]|nr:hypothetical protein [Myxococcus sp.]
MAVLATSPSHALRSIGDDMGPLHRALGMATANPHGQRHHQARQPHSSTIVNFFRQCLNYQQACPELNAL